MTGDLDDDLMEVNRMNHSPPGGMTEPFQPQPGN